MSWLYKVYKALQVFTEPFNFNFSSISDWGIDLDYCDVEWFALEVNWVHSVIFEIAPKYCISDSFVDHEGDSISSKLILKEINPEYSLKALMLKLKL